MCAYRVHVWPSSGIVIDRLRYYLGVYPWGHFLQCNDVLYSQFVDIIFDVVSRSVPSKTVVLGPKDPNYITPLIKSLLKQRTRLRR